MNRWIKRIPGWVWLAAAGLLLAAFWLRQHDARIRQQADLKQLQQQTAAQVAALKKQAQQDIRQANVENAEAIQKLEARRQQMEQQNRQLAAQLDALRKQAQIQADQVATLPIRDVVTRVAAQLGFDSADGSSADIAKNTTSAPPATPHPAAGTATLSPGRGLGSVSSAHLANGAMSAPPATPHPAAGAATLSPGRGLGSVSSAHIAIGAMYPPPTDAVATNEAVMALTDSGARKVESALVQLNACKAESKIQNQQIANCQARVAAADATIQRLNGSVASLNQALEAKDKILAQQDSEYRAEVKVAKGSFLGRLAHVTEHVAIGVAVGVVLGVVIR